MLSSSRGQGNFRGPKASRPRTWPSRPRPRTSKCVLEDVLEAKDVLEDSTSEKKVFKNFFQAIYKILTIYKILLSSSRGQAIFEAVAYTGFWKGRGQELQKIWVEERSESEISPISCPKLGEEQKKKVFTQIWSDFLPKLGCRPKTIGQNIPFV